MTLSLCLPYYRNPVMLAEQYRVWAGYPDDLKAQIEIVIVEDGSVGATTHPWEVPQSDGLPPLRFAQLLPDPQGPIPPWRQHAARNRAASEALGPWLLLTDMDHVLPADSLQKLLAVLERASEADVFTFHRVDADTKRPTLNERGEWKPHVNTFALTKAHFWAVGGYDEECLGYGTDSYFRRRLLASVPAIHLDDVPIIRYPREVIADASTSEPGVEPRELRRRGRRPEVRQRAIQKMQRREPITALSIPWERVG